LSAVAGRRVEPEWLDTLPPGDARARRSRRDLARVNALMANAGIVARALAGAGMGSPRSLVEIGAGDGGFAARLAAALPEPAAGATFTLLDRQDTAEPAALARIEARGWTPRVVVADVFEWLEARGPEHEAIVANLFLHHFEDDALGRMLSLAARRARCFVACEPRRSALALAGSRMLAAIGCNDVTRHDAVVSVRAGFRDGEVSALWPRDAPWTLAERARGLFSHGFAAWKE
jgi:hypothetical protein